MSDTEQKGPEENESEESEEKVERPDDAPDGLSLAVNRNNTDEDDKDVAEL